MPYLGKDPSRLSGERLSENVVFRLMEPFLDKGRNVTTDNFFTSLSLAQWLLSRKITFLGTVNKIPQSTRQTDVIHSPLRYVYVFLIFVWNCYENNNLPYLLVVFNHWCQMEEDRLHSQRHAQRIYGYIAKKKPRTVNLYNTTWWIRWSKSTLSAQEHDAGQLPCSTTWSIWRH